MRATLFMALMACSVLAAEPPVSWRSDYTAGRKEAAEGSKAVCLVIGSENCFYCRKLEAATLADTAVVAALRQGYIAIKIDAAREAELVKALNVQLYPTTVLAAPDGTIHAIINGYVSADQMRDHLKKTLVVIAEDEKLDRDYKSAKAAFDAGDVSKSATLLRGMLIPDKNRPIQSQAKELLEKVDRQAATRAAVQAVRPQALLDVAKQLHDAHRLSDALDVAAEVTRSHPHTQEAKQAVALIETIRSNPETLLIASRQADEKAATLQLALSESLLKRGDTVAAKTALEQVIRLTPGSATAETAQFHLTKLKQPMVAIPATLKK